MRIAILIAAALAGTGLAGAQTGAIDPDRLHPGVRANTQHPALSGFSMQQRAAIYDAVMRGMPTTSLPSDLQITVGTKLPQSAELHALPDDVRARIALAGKYKYAIWRNQVLLVDPAESTVADILHGWVLRDYK